MKITYLFGFVSLLSVVACNGSTIGEESSDSTNAKVQKDDEKAPENTPAPTPASPASPAPSNPVPAKNPSPSDPSCTPLPSTQGGMNPAPAYCRNLGYSIDSNGDCVFPDGTTCEPWSFWRGECGGEHSFCALHGGTVSSVEEKMGTWVGVNAVCTLPDGHSCHDQDFAKSCTCQ